MNKNRAVFIDKAGRFLYNERGGIYNLISESMLSGILPYFFPFSKIFRLNLTLLNLYYYAQTGV